MKKVMCLVVALISVFVYGFAFAASPNPTVTVVNTSSNPVPVTGNLAISGTANVNVTNAALPVTGSVGITGTPNVKVTNDSIPVTGNVSISETPKEFVFFQGFCTAEPNFRNCLSDLNQDLGVPEGKRLVIENFSCNANVPSGVSLSCYLRPKIKDKNGATMGYDVFIPTSPVSITDNSTISAGQPVKTYLKFGDTLGFGGYRNQALPLTSVVFDFLLLGYYEAIE